MTQYAGADWVAENIKYGRHPDMQMSDLGRAVADFLGELYHGIYHLSNKAIDRVDWSDKRCIIISIGWNSWSTVDFDVLTRLVFLAHHTSLRVDLTPSTHQYMRVMFHHRGRSGDAYTRHPTLDEAVERFKKNVSIPEFQEVT